MRGNKVILIIFLIVIVGTTIIINWYFSSRLGFIYILCFDLLVLAIIAVVFFSTYKIQKVPKIKECGKLYYKSRERRAKTWSYVYRIEVETEILEFYVPPDLYDSINEGDKVIFEYTTVFGGARWITWIESYR